MSLRTGIFKDAMKMELSFKKWETVLLGLVLGLASYLLFKNLGNIFLWQDEAQTGLLAKTVLQFGVPRGYDGLNYFSQELGAEYGPGYLWKWHTWLPFYVLAGCYKLFGFSTFVSRLPFALAALGCFVALYFLTRELFSSRSAALFSVSTLLVSVPFYLLSRQCRYYSFTMLFVLLGLYGYIRLLHNRRGGGTLYLVAGTCLFHSHYVYFGTMLMTVAFHALFFWRHRWRAVFLWSLLLCVINLPWMIWLASMRYGERYGGSMGDLVQIWGRFVRFVADIQRYYWLGFWLFTLVVLIVVSRLENQAERKTDLALDGLLLTVAFVAINLLVLSVFAPWPFFRYLAPLLPLFAMIIGVVLAKLQKIHTIFVLSFLLILWHEPIPDFFYELHHDYSGPIEAIVTYLNANAQKGDIVAATYGDMPIKFYTNLRVIGGLTGEDLHPAVGADWLIIRSGIVSDKDYAVRQFLIRNTDWRQYEPITLPVPDLLFENREDPGQHMFKSPEMGYPPVVIYKKKRSG